MISIVIISYNTANLTANCVESIFANYGESNEIIIVDNSSTDNTIELLSEKFGDRIVLIENKTNFGYAKAVNIGMQKASNEICLVINSDIIFLEDYKTAIEYFDSNNIGVMGLQQLYPNKKWQRSYGEYPSITLELKNLFFITFLKNILNKMFFYINIQKIKNVEYVDGAFLFVKKSLFNSIKGFDEDYFFYTEEVDYCYRVSSANLKVIFYPFSKVIHYRGASQKEKAIKRKSIEMMINNNILFLKKRKQYNKTKLKIYLLLAYLNNLKLEKLSFLHYKKQVHKIKKEIILNLLINIKI